MFLIRLRVYLDVFKFYNFFSIIMLVETMNLIVFINYYFDFLTQIIENISLMHKIFIIFNTKCSVMYYFWNSI